MRLIETPQDIAEGVSWLRAHDPVLTRAIDACENIPLRRNREGFAQLVQAIIGQQVSTASAAAIMKRVVEQGLIDPEIARGANDETYQLAGLSRPKIRYIRALAIADIDFDGLRGQTDTEVVKTLTAVTGIGQWTAEIYAMFSLGRADMFAHGDLALQEAVRALYQLPTRPNERDMRAFAQRWSPWRAVAARVLWAYYRVMKNREGVL